MTSRYWLLKAYSPSAISAFFKRESKQIHGSEKLCQHRLRWHHPSGEAGSTRQCNWAPSQALSSAPASMLVPAFWSGDGASLFPLRLFPALFCCLVCMRLPALSAVVIRIRRTLPACTTLHTAHSAALQAHIIQQAWHVSVSMRSKTASLGIASHLSAVYVAPRQCLKPAVCSVQEACSCQRRPTPWLSAGSMKRARPYCRRCEAPMMWSSSTAPLWWLMKLSRGRKILGSASAGAATGPSWHWPF